MSDKPNCTLCGKPMPDGEEMFMYHGHSGPCPKPPLPKAKPLSDDEWAKAIIIHLTGRPEDPTPMLLKMVADIRDGK